MGIRSAALISALALAAPAPAAPPRLATASGQWAVLLGEQQCDATALSLLHRDDPARQASASISFTRDGRQRGVLAIRLGRAVGDGGVLLRIDDQPFLLAASGTTAWSRGPDQERAIHAALRRAGGMRIEARDRAGRRFAERFLLDGAPTAIDAAAVACLR